MSDLLVVLAAITAVAVAALPAGHPAGRTGPPVLIRSSGALKVTNSREGLPVVSGAPVWPGYHIRGRVTVTYQGPDGGALRLTPRHLRGSPAPDGGSLAPWLRLRVFHVVRSGELAERYAGRLSRAYVRRLGDGWHPGGSRLYAIRARVPLRLGDRFQGSRARFGLLWTAAGSP